MCEVQMTMETSQSDPGYIFYMYAHKQMQGSSGSTSNSDCTVPPVNIVYEKQGASCFHHVHCSVNVLHPLRESKMSQGSGLPLHSSAFHCPEN